MYTYIYIFFLKKICRRFHKVQFFHGSNNDRGGLCMCVGGKGERGRGGLYFKIVSLFYLKIKIEK